MTVPTTAAALLADLDPALACLADEPAAVRDCLGQFAIVTFLVGDRNDAGDRLVEAITLGLALTEDDVERLMPHGRIDLESLAVIPPATDPARALAFLLICAVASTSRPPTRTQIQVLGHLGVGLGLDQSPTDVATRISAALDLPLAEPNPA